jgi:hypothetical protein
MELRAVVTYSGYLAHYAVTPDNFGVYHARLLKYDGPNGYNPPESLILVKGERHWVSSCEERHFADDLGRVIEHRVRGGDPHAQV